MSRIRCYAVILVAVGTLWSGDALSQGTSPDLTELIQQANAGDAMAQFRLANAYDSGRGAARDAKEAMRWYRAAAELGLAEAQNSVGSGLQAEKRYAEALTWYEKAASQKHAMATNNLAYLHDLGLGVPQDRLKAFALYGKAADLGLAEAMWNLTNMVGAGQVGQPPDLAAACVWAVKAQRYAAPDERQLQAQLRRVMPEFQRRLTSEQWGACRDQAFAWTPPEMANRSDLPK